MRRAQHAGCWLHGCIFEIFEKGSKEIQLKSRIIKLAKNADIDKTLSMREATACDMTVLSDPDNISFTSDGWSFSDSN